MATMNHPSDIEVGQTLVIDGETRRVHEIFRAVGTFWIRYLHVNKSSGYATETEWRVWMSSNFNNLSID